MSLTPRPLEAICLKALAYERTARYAGVSKFSADGANFLGVRRVLAYPERLLESLLAVKYRTVLTLLAGVAVGEMKARRRT